ncbi:metallophosphoesterase [bacterium]|nr:metallophosphoesterase [bacterium]
MSALATRIDGPVAVIGDVHGQTNELEEVLSQLQRLPDFERRWLVFIGDLVDRGPDPRGALDIVCDLIEQHPRTTIVAGNHELAMAGALGLVPTPDYAEWPTRWVNDYLSESTFESFGVEHGDLDALRNRLSERHVELLARMPWCVEHPEFLFVHAGLDPNTPFEMQLRILRQKDYSLNRPPWLCSKSLVTAPVPQDCRVTVVSGHVRVPEVSIQPKRILIDTTGGESGDLSCVLLPEKKVVTSGHNSRREPQTVGADSSSGSKSWWKFW